MSLHEALEHCLRLIQPQLEAKSIGVVRRFEASADRVQGDDNQLQQAFLNLFLNAMDAMSPGGTLTVSTRSLAPAAAPGLTLHDQGSPRIGITVQDTGMGIAPEDLARIFEPFFTSKPNGTGLGLSITRRIIHAHHGEISVQSQPGQGTVVSLTLPAAA